MPKDTRDVRKSPAWLGGGGGKPLSGVSGAGVQSMPSWYQNEYQNYMSGATAGDIGNPNVPAHAIALDSAPGAVQARIRAGAPNLGTGDVRYQNQAPSQQPLRPQGGLLPTLPPRVNPRTGQPLTSATVNRNVYNDTPPMITPQGTPNMGVDSFIGGGGEVVPHPGGGVVRPWDPAGVNTFIGGGGLAMRGPEELPWWMQPGGDGSGGFGTNYGGNWRRGGGGGGYGGGGWSDIPKWLMGLYDWRYNG